MWQPRIESIKQSFRRTLKYVHDTLRKQAVIRICPGNTEKAPRGLELDSKINLGAQVLKWDWSWKGAKQQSKEV